jgi:hypothetical protein
MPLTVEDRLKDQAARRSRSRLLRMAGSSASGRKRKLMIKKVAKTDADDLEKAKEQRQAMANAKRRWCPGAAVEGRIFCTSLSPHTRTGNSLN